MTHFPTWPYELRQGHSTDPAQGTCALDVVSWMVYGRHGDKPECSCPIIASYVISGGDGAPDDVRQRLKPYLHRIAGSRSMAHGTARLRILVLGAVRVFAPRTLDAAGLHADADRLRSLPDDVTYERAAEAAEVPVRVKKGVRTTVRAVIQAARVEAEMAAAVKAKVWAARSARLTQRGGWRMAAEAAGVTAARAAETAAVTWDDYFDVLDAALSAGPQGEPWSADVVERQVALFDAAAHR